MFKVKVDMGNIATKVPAALKFGQFAIDNAVLKDSNYYIPKDHGYLEESGVLNSKIGEGTVAWSTPYARKLYYNPQYNFSKDKNTNASGLWFEKSKAQNRSSWLKQGEKATKSKL